MRVLYLVNSSAEFRSVLPFELSEQGFDVITASHKINSATEIDANYLITDRYPHKLPADICARFCDRSLNLHASLLPNYRGSFPILFSILNGDVPGWSVHRIAPVIDRGEVLFQSLIDMDLQVDTLRTLWTRCQKEMFRSVIENFSFFSSQGSFRGFSPHRSKEDGSFFYRDDYFKVAHLLSNGWDTSVAEIFGTKPRCH